jgi:hypothetical protein
VISTQIAQGPVDDLMDGRIRRQTPVLGEIADAAVGMDDDLSLVGPLTPGEQAQQGGLAGSVLADDPGALTRGERARH